MQGFAFHLSKLQHNVKALMAERFLHISALSCQWAMPVFWTAGRKGRQGGEAASLIWPHWGLRPAGAAPELQGAAKA